MPNVPLSVFFCLEVHERGVTRQTCLAGFCCFLSVSLSGKDTRQVAAPMASVVRPSLVACAKTFAEGVPLFHVRQPQTRPWAQACHQHLQIWHLHTFTHPRLPSLSSLVPQLPMTRGKSHRGSSQSPRQRLTLSHWSLSSKSGERSLCHVSHLASWIIVVCSFDGTFSLSHKANLRAPSRTLRTHGVS